jgi:hypothetical protein
MYYFFCVLIILFCIFFPFKRGLGLQHSLYVRTVRKSEGEKDFHFTWKFVPTGPTRDFQRMLELAAFGAVSGRRVAGNGRFLNLIKN